MSMQVTSLDRTTTLTSISSPAAYYLVHLHLQATFVSNICVQVSMYTTGGVSLACCSQTQQKKRRFVELMFESLPSV
jgi:hypothetical protein